MFKSHLTHFCLTIIQGLGIVLLADFIAGLIHWLEDAYFTEDTPVIGPLFIKANIVHHHLPRHFTRLSWWQSSADLLAVGVALLAAGWWFGFLTWQLWLFVVISVNANQVHKWAHRTRTENGPVVSFFQDIGVLLTPRQHAIHHSDPKNTFYCPVTNLVNPLLERLRFWPRLAIAIWRATGRRHRRDTSNRGQGPGPAWLSAYRAPGAKNNSPQLIPPLGPTSGFAAAAIPTCTRCGDCRRAAAGGPVSANACRRNPRGLTPPAIASTIAVVPRPATCSAQS